jgi:hypothetical protein
MVNGRDVRRLGLSWTMGDLAAKHPSRERGFFHGERSDLMFQNK